MRRARPSHTLSSRSAVSFPSAMQLRQLIVFAVVAAASLFSGPTPASALPSFSDLDCCVSLVVYLYAETAAGPSFPAVALPVSLYSGSAHRRDAEDGVLALSDSYGVARFSLPSSVGFHCCRCRLEQQPIAHSRAVRAAAASFVVSINEARLPHHRPDWSASRWQLHDELQGQCTSAEERLGVVAVTVQQLSPSPLPPLRRSAADRLTRSVAGLLLLVVCCCWSSLSLLHSFCARPPLPLWLSLCRRLLLSWPLSSSSQQCRPDSIVVPASVALLLLAPPAAPTSSSGGEGSSAAAVSACCQCSLCTTAPSRARAAASTSTKRPCDAARRQLRLWQSDPQHNPQQSALLICT